MLPKFSIYIIFKNTAFTIAPAECGLQDSREGLSQEQGRKDVEESYYQVIKNLNNDDINKDWD
jgi:uncharacterized membrane protein